MLINYIFFKKIFYFKIHLSKIYMAKIFYLIFVKTMYNYFKLFYIIYFGILKKDLFY